MSDLDARLLRLLEVAAAGKLTHSRVFVDDGDLTELRDVYKIALHRGLFEPSMHDEPRKLTLAGWSELAVLRERSSEKPPPNGDGKGKRRGGRRPLDKADPKRQVYDRIRQERKTGERNAIVRERLKADKDFMELFRAAKLNWKTVFKNARAYFGQPGKKPETPST
jgi:hypothetical protein